jgi:hypothetical protein
MRIFNNPSFVELSDYHRAIEKYIKRVSSVSGVVSVSTMGSIRAPGLSDIDIVLVVRDDFAAPDSLKLNVRGIDDRLFLHGPIIIPEFAVQDVQKIIYASNLETLIGPSILPDFQDIDPFEQRVLAGCYLVDFLESRFKQFATVNGHLDKRVWLTRVWSTTHSCTLYQKVFGEDLSVTENRWLADIHQTREDWRRNREVSDKVLVDAYQSAWALNISIFMKTLRKLYGEVALEGPVVLWDQARKIYFQNDVAEPHFNQRSLRLLGRRFYALQAVLPSSYRAHLETYGLLEEANWRHEPTVDESVRLLMRRRAEAVVEHSAWLAGHTPQSGAMAGYLGLQVPTFLTPKTCLRNLLARVLLAKPF